MSDVFLGQSYDNSIKKAEVSRHSWAKANL